MNGQEAFGGKYPMTETWFLGKNVPKSRVHDLIDEVDRMLLNLYRDECIHILVQERFGPGAEAKLPPVAGVPAGPECDDLDCLRCHNVIAEYQALSDLRWMLTRMADGTFRMVRDALKDRLEESDWLPDLYYIENYVSY